MNIRAKLIEADETNRNAVRERFSQLHRVTVCKADACQQGAVPCPCPQECEIDAMDHAESFAVWCAIGIALVALIGALSLVAGWM